MTAQEQPIHSLKKRAKALMKAVAGGDLAACERARRVLRNFSESSFGLMKAQHVVAVEHGFPSWADVLDAPPAELYRAITKVQQNRKYDLQTQERIREILRALGADVPADVLGRPIHLLSVSPITGGSSSTLAVARRIAAENAARRAWALDLAHFQGTLSEHQAMQLMATLKDEGIPFWEERGLGSYWVALQAPQAMRKDYHRICDTFGVPVGAVVVP